MLKPEAQNCRISTKAPMSTQSTPSHHHTFEFTPHHQLLHQSPLVPYTRALFSLTHMHTHTHYTARLARERWVLKKQQWRWHSFTHGRRTRVQVLAGNILILYTGEEEKESLVIGNSPFTSELKWQAGIRIRRSLWTTGRIREGDQRMSITLHSFWNYILNSRSGQSVACNPTYHLS